MPQVKVGSYNISKEFVHIVLNIKLQTNLVYIGFYGQIDTDHYTLTLKFLYVFVDYLVI